MTPENNVELLKEATVKAAEQVAKRPDNKLEPADAALIAMQMLDKMTPVIQHVTNSEAWIQSRVTVGALVAVIGGLIGIATLGWHRSTDMQAWTTAGTSLVGGLTILHGKYIAKKPIGA